jgi:hypothetical protein
MIELGAIAWLYAGIIIGMIVMAVILVPIQYYRQRKQLRFAYKFHIKQKRKGTPMQEATITNEQKIAFALNPITESGNVAPLDGPPRLSVVSGDGAFNLAEDGLSGELISTDTPSDTTYLLEADADLGEGTELIQETILIHTAGAKAKNFGFAFSTPVPK